METVEIRLSDIFRFIKKYILFFVLAGFFGILFGYGLSYLYQKEYKASTRLLPEYASTSGGDLNQLANLAGLSLRARTEAIRPDLYPEIIRSSQFIIQLLHQDFKDINGNTTNLFTYFSNKLKKEDDFEIKPFSAEQISGKDTVLFLTKEQQILVKILRSRLAVSYGKMDGIITIAIELPDPLLAVNSVRFAVDYLITFVKSYRTEKLDMRVKLLQGQSSEAERRYKESLRLLSTYRDSNRDIFTSSARIREEELLSEHRRNEALYNDLSHKLELAILQREEETPVIKILDPPITPYTTSKPRRLIMGASYGLLFGFLALVYVLFYKERIQKYF